MDLCETKFDSLLSALKIEDKMDHLSDIGDIVEIFKFYVSIKKMDQILYQFFMWTHYWFWIKKASSPLI